MNKSNKWEQRGTQINNTASRKLRKEMNTRKKIFYSAEYRSLVDGLQDQRSNQRAMEASTLYYCFLQVYKSKLSTNGRQVRIRSDFSGKFYFNKKRG